MVVNWKGGRVGGRERRREWLTMGDSLARRAVARRPKADRYPLSSPFSLTDGRLDGQTLGKLSPSIVICLVNSSATNSIVNFAVNPTDSAGRAPSFFTCQTAERSETGRR